MAYPVGIPYGLNNFNDLYAMLGVWAGQNKTNTDLFNMYKQYMQNQKTSVQSPIQDNNNKPADTLEYNKKQQPAAETQTDASVREEQALLAQQQAYLQQLAQQQAAAEAQAAAQTQTQTQTQAAPAGQNTQAGQTPSAQTQAASEANNMNDIYKKYYDRLEALKTEAMSDFNKIVLSPGPGIV